MDRWRYADCVFCDPEKLPPHAVWSAGKWPGLFRVFEPLNPVTPGHLLVVPRHHVRDLAEDPEVTAGAMYVASKVAARLHSANIITSMGTPATQSVFHLHLHVVPRTADDGLHLPWTGQHKTQPASEGHSALEPSTEGAESR